MKRGNTWVRDPNAPPGGSKPDSKPAKPEGPGPIKVGRFKLVRSPSLLSNRQQQQQQRTLPARAPKPGIDKSKFKYERPKEDAGQGPPAGGALPEKAQQQAVPVATGVGGAQKPQSRIIQKPQAAVPPRKLKGNLTWINPSTAGNKLNAPTEVKPSKPDKPQQIAPAARVQPMRPGKAKWNSYVRPRASIDPPNSIKSSTSTKNEKTVPRTPKASSIAPATGIGPRRSARLKTTKRTLAPQAQQAMKLLRLGGRVYSVGSRGKGRSLTLQAAGDQTSAPTAQPVKRPPAATARRKSAPLTKRATAATPSYKKPPVPRNTFKKSAQLKPSDRLKGGPRVKYCPVYCHTGKCPRRGRGCSLRHDPTKRAVCTQWLTGRCTLGKACLLQHQRKPELMPACVHFLQGCCTNSECPWLHVKVRRDAGYCAAFLRGYCAAGTSCALKHYTLRQVKEERRLVAGGASKKTTSKKTEAPSDAPRPRKKRERYFDYEESEVEEEQQQEAASSEANTTSDIGEESSGAVEGADDEEQEGEDQEETRSLDSRSSGGRKRMRRSSLLNLDFIQL